MTFKLDSVVWGKMGRFPPWPGIIAEPSEDMKKAPKGSGSMHCVYFFGSHNYSWLDAKSIQPFAEFKEANTKGKHSVSFMEAVNEAEEYISSGSKGIPTPSKKAKKRPSDSTKVDEKEKVAPKKKKESSGPKTPKSSVLDRVFVSPKTIVKKTKVTTLDRSVLDGEDANVFKSPRASLIDRPYVTDPETKITDVTLVADSLKDKNISPSPKKIGFLGLGIMGSRIAKYILQSGHKLMIWNRTPEKCEQFTKAGAEVGMTPADVVQHSDIVFCCVSGPDVSNDLVNGNCGVLSEMDGTKGYVEFTGVDRETSRDIDANVTGKGGRYLEVQILGSMTEAEDGELVFLCAGDKSLFDDCNSCLSAASKVSRFIGPIGNAVELFLVYQVIRNIHIAGAAEFVSLAKRLKLPVESLIQMVGIKNPLLNEKFNSMKDEEFSVSQPLQHAQKNVKFALEMGDKLHHALPVTSAVNEVYKHSCRLGLGTHDAASLFIRDYKY